MDSALLQAAGVETVVFGATGAGAHAEVEWVDLESVDEVGGDSGGRGDQLLCMMVRYAETQLLCTGIVNAHNLTDVPVFATI